MPHIYTYSPEGWCKQAWSLLAEGHTAGQRWCWWKQREPHKALAGTACSRSQRWEEKVSENILFTWKKFKEQTQLVSGYGMSQAQGRHILSDVKKQAGIWSTSSSPRFRTAAKHPALMLTVSGFEFPPALHTDHSSGGSLPSRPLWRNRLSFQGLM